jgi:hypothetical protein
MVQAATAGVVDFGRADPRDLKWWRHLRLIVDQLERNNLREYYRLYYDRTVTVLGRTDLSHESATRLLDESDTRIDSIAKLLFPWITWDRQKIREQEAVQLRASWEAWFGKLDDPDTQRRIRETAAWLRSTTRKTPRMGRR